MKRLLSIVITVLLATTALAQTGTAAKKKELPREGSLSFSGGMGGETGIGVAMPWGSDNEGSAPITGSVSKSGPDTWMMRVFNNSEEPYSVSLKVLQFNPQGTQVKSDSFSYTLKPGQKAERSVSAGSGSTRGELKLESWKNLGEKKKEAKTDDGAAGGAPDQADK